MKTQRLTAAAVSVIVFLAFVQMPAVQAAPARPNFVVIFTDDQGYGAAGFFFLDFFFLGFFLLAVYVAPLSGGID